MESMPISERLRMFRKSKKITATEMAKFFGKTSAGYGFYETGKRNIPIEETFLLHSMGCNLNWLITGKGNMYWDAKTDPPSENELIRTLITSNEKQANSLENSTKTAENCSVAVLNLSEFIKNSKSVSIKGGNKGNIMNDNNGNIMY
jgi:transcriptional regulator with XRE-family HTH domain